MPNHGTYRQRTSAPSHSLPPDAWRALVQLPGQVVVAATAVPPGLPAPLARAGDPTSTGAAGRQHRPVPRDGVAETLAGLEAIAAGRGSASPLVREIVSAIYLEDAGYQPTRNVLDRCTRAGAALAAGAGRADSDAYLHWIEAIATRVCHAANSDAVFDTGGPTLSPRQARFVAALRAAFDR